MRRNAGQWFATVLAPTLVAVFFVALGAAEVEQQQRIIEQGRLHAAVVDAEHHVRGAVAEGLFALRAVRGLWLSSEEVTMEEFAIFAASLTDESSPFVSLQWADADAVVRYVHPLAGENLSAVGLDNKRFPNRYASIIRARETGDAVITPPVQLVQGYPGIIVYLPMEREGEYLGSVVGVARLSALLAEAERVLSPYAAYRAIRIGDKIVPLHGAAIYTLEGKRVLDPGGTVGAVAEFPVSRAADEALEGEPSHAAKDANGSMAFVEGAAAGMAHFFPVSGDRWRLIALAPPAAALSRPAILLLAIGGAFALLIMLFLQVLYRQRRILADLAQNERDFAAMVSHQLREPLAQIGWALEELADADLPEDRAASVGELRRLVSGSAKFVRDVLDASKIERGALTVDVGSHPAGALLEEAAYPLRSAAERRSVKLSIDAPDGLVVAADKEKAVEAVRNIIDNAIDHGPAGNVVIVAARAEGDAVVISVSDRGPGIPKEMREHIFDRSSAMVKKDGFGLGLHLAKRFIELMGGSIRFETSPDGTTFFIELPSGRPAGGGAA